MDKILDITRKLIEELRAINAEESARPNALLVEDNQAEAELLSEILATAGLNVFTIFHGSEALAFFRAYAQQPFRPHIVFLDLKLPGASGVEILRLIKQKDRGLPVVIVTGYLTGELIEQAREIGFLELIEKPLRLDDAAEIVMKHRLNPQGLCVAAPL